MIKQADNVTKKERKLLDSNIHHYITNTAFKATPESNETNTIHPHDLGYKRVAALNLGCKTNRYETDAVLADFSQRGYEIVNFNAEADIYIINTCSVTGEAGRKSGQMVRRARKQNPAAIVVAMGCHVELGAESLGADITVGNIGKATLPSLISAWLAQNPDGQHTERLNFRAIAGSLNADQTPRFEEFGPQVVQSESRGIIKIQDGCNNFCTYCAIPLARGRVRSRQPDLILKEVANLTGRGFREMVLTGIHICSYGQDFHEDDKAWDGLDMIRLLEAMAAIPGVERIRLGSLEPKSVSPEFARRLGMIPQICPHIHLSLQSGSEAVLKRMNRKYTAVEYREAVMNLRTQLPGMNLTTDIIVGFPGETEAEHLESLAFCEEMGFGRIHIFRYSTREGTPAARFKNQVPAEIMQSRSAAFQELATALLAKRQQAILDTEAAVLLESQSRDGSWGGYTEGYDVVEVGFAEEKEIREGDIWRVRLVKANGDVLMAKPLDRVSIGMLEA